LVYIPPPNWAKRATNDAPKPYPTRRRGTTQNHMESATVTMSAFAFEKLIQVCNYKHITSGLVNAVNLYITILTRYSLRPIVLFANIDVSRHILVLDTSVLAKSNMGRREFFCISRMSDIIIWLQVRTTEYVRDQNNSNIIIT
jgi:hypothetical protein